MNAYQRWLDLKLKQKEIEDQLLQTEVELYTIHAEELNTRDKGTINVTAPGYKLKVIKRENVKVDQVLAAAIEVGFRKKYELDQRAFDALPEEKRRLVAEALTISPGKPTFSVEVADAG